MAGAKRQPAGADAAPNVRNGSRWYSSFYWRIGISFVVFLIAVIAAQGLMFSFMLARTANLPRGWSPAIDAIDVAADLGAALDRDPALSLDDYIQRASIPSSLTVFVVMRDGRTASSTERPLAVAVQRFAEAALAGQPFPRGGSSGSPGPIVMTAPILVRNELAGLIVIPPPLATGIAREFGRMLSLPGTLLLIVASALAATIIFAPARRRLQALEVAAERLGSGDSTARAPDTGGDEIARVARAFNRMAHELSERSDALRQSDRLRRQMLADVSHELKTPLTSIRGYLETLRMPEVIMDQETRERHLDTVDRETRRLERIVADLLDLARFENNAAPLDVRLFAIDRVFSHVVARHEREAAAAGVTIQTTIREGADHLAADPHRIEQVIDNLVANAIRHTAPGGTVHLEAARSEDRAVLWVIDSGDGIAPEHLPHVFDRFYKVDAARAASPGSGLGLTIARAIVQRHGGLIQVASVPGRTEFWFELPQSGVSGANL
jgi:two-component system OmpR family sensor kinase